MYDFWKETEKLESKKYNCGYCGNSVSSNEGYFMTSNSYNGTRPTGQGYIYICHHCNKPTFFDFYGQVPSPKYGRIFDKEIFNDIVTYELYEEIRNCMKANAYTACVMLCRKMLMHIGVDCGAEIDKSFQYYVNYLDEQNFIPKNCKDWVDIIREKGNEANHDIVMYKESDAKQMINFVEIIIAVVYEMKYQADKYVEQSQME